MFTGAVTINSIAVCHQPILRLWITLT